MGCVSLWGVLETWLLLQGAKGMQESVNVLCLFFAPFPSKFLPILTGEKLSTLWPRLMIPASACNATSTYMWEIPLLLFLPNRAWGCPLRFRRQQPLSTDSCTASHLPSLLDFSRLASACGRWTWSSSSPCQSHASQRLACVLKCLNLVSGFRKAACHWLLLIAITAN